MLKNLADKGIDPKLIESAIHQVEFHHKEITNTPYPYGIKLLLFFSESWFHGGDPIKILRFDDDLKQLNEERAKGALFENRIKTYLLNNPHRVLFKLTPDQMMEQKENERVRTELGHIKSGLPPAELDKIKKDAEALVKLQESGEDLSSLPTLEIEDIPPSVRIVKETDLKLETKDSGTGTADFQFPISNFHLPAADFRYFLF